jgi:hypothetical protein
MNDLDVPKLFWELWPLAPVGMIDNLMRTHGITIRLGPELKQRLHNAARKLDLSENDIARHALRAAVDWLERNDYRVGPPFEIVSRNRPLVSRPVHRPKGKITGLNEREGRYHRRKKDTQ